MSYDVLKQFLDQLLSQNSSATLARYILAMMQSSPLTFSPRGHLDRPPAVGGILVYAGYAKLTPITICGRASC